MADLGSKMVENTESETAHAAFSGVEFKDDKDDMLVEEVDRYVPSIYLAFHFIQPVSLSGLYMCVIERG